MCIITMFVVIILQVFIIELPLHTVADAFTAH